MNLRPSRPSESHGTREPGPPERRSVVGCSTPSGVIPLRTENVSLARLTRPLNNRPLTIRYVTPATAIQPTAFAARGPIQRLELLHDPAIDPANGTADQQDEAEDQRGD